MERFALGDRIQIRAAHTRPLYYELGRDVAVGLAQKQKKIPPKYFYDEKGSILFDLICTTPEYYPTRTEDKLLSQYSNDIVEEVRPELIVELGSGASRKTTRLLDACDLQGIYPVYQPVDICAEMLQSAGQRLIQRYEWLEVDGVAGDYCTGLRDVAGEAESRMFVFLGGTLGNFEEKEAQAFLSDVAREMRESDWLLLGVDRVKDTDVLNAAYNDSRGYTADFNLNVLDVLNRELSANFDTRQFRHHAGFNAQKSRIEMHLQSERKQQVLISDLDQVVELEAGETILTEISRKYTEDSLRSMMGAVGLDVIQHFQPVNRYFSLVLARPVVS